MIQIVMTGERAVPEFQKSPLITLEQRIPPDATQGAQNGSPVSGLAIFSDDIPSGILRSQETDQRFGRGLPIAVSAASVLFSAVQADR